MKASNPVSERIDRLIQAWQRLNDAYFAINLKNLTPSKLMREDGNKYCKLVNVNGNNRSAYAFINLTTGDIFMPAGWKAPAKGIRGNVNADDFGLSCCGPYGVEYLRGPSVRW